MYRGLVRRRDGVAVRMARAQYWSRTLLPAHATIDAHDTMAHNESVRPSGRVNERERDEQHTS